MTTKKIQTIVLPKAKQDKTIWVILGVSLAIVLYARLSLLGIPLERDEGGYAYIGQRLFGNQLLYTDMLDIKLPGLYFLYWIFDQLPGGQEKSIHLGLLLMHGGALAIFFVWVRKAFNAPIAAIASALFAISALMPGVFGFAAHATQLIQLPVMAALYLLWGYIQDEQHRRFWQLPATGLLLGFAFTVKQPSIVFIVFAIGVLLLGHGSFLQKIGRAFIGRGASTISGYGPSPCQRHRRLVPTILFFTSKHWFPV